MTASKSIILLFLYPIITEMIRGMESASMGSGATPVDCSDVQLSKCITPNNINKFKLFSNQDELDSLCRLDINERLRCIDNYTRNCMDNEQRSHFNSIYSASTMVIQEICQDGGEYRKEFLKHSPCLKSNEAAHEACAVSYSKSLEDIKDKAKAGLGDNSHIKDLCCSLQEYIRCSKESVTKACGADTARFTSGFLDRMVSGLVENHCQNHKILDGQCSEDLSKNGSAAMHQQSIFLFFLLPYIFMLLYKFF